MQTTLLTMTHQVRPPNPGATLARHTEVGEKMEHTNLPFGGNLMNCVAFVTQQHTQKGLTSKVCQLRLTWISRLRWRVELKDMSPNNRFESDGLHFRCATGNAAVQAKR